MPVIHALLLSARLVRAFYLACHHQCRAAGPGRRPTGPFRLLYSMLFGACQALDIFQGDQLGKDRAELPHGCFRVCFQHKAEYKAVAVHITHGGGV